MLSHLHHPITVIVLPQVVKNKYIVYNLSLHMSETSCPAHVTRVYSGMNIYFVENSEEKCRHQQKKDEKLAII